MKRTLLLICMNLGLAALLGAFALPSLLPASMHRLVQVVYNPSDSVPRGWYRIRAAGPPRVGGIVMAWLPAEAAALAARRNYLPLGVPLLKRIGAVSPQWVCVDRTTVRIDGQIVARLRRVDGRGRPLHAWLQCRHLMPGELFLLSNTSADSFDSRYFGPISVDDVIGSARPLWAWGTP
jgi:conjugative transfer signal peptidase TraF